MEKWVKDFIHWCDNHHIEIPHSQNEILKMKIFNAKNKRLTSIHPNIAYLKNLEHIILTHNMLIDLPQLPKKITTLSLSHNLFREIPPEIEKLEKLNTLIFSHNTIETVPNWIVSLSFLHIFDITNNKIHSIENLKGNVNIKILLVANNKIEDISPIYTMENLMIFDFSDNKVAKFDKRIRKLKHLKLFLGSNNPIVGFDLPFLLGNIKSDIQVHNKKFKALEILFYLRKKLHLELA